jgi:putative transposase
MPNHVHLLISEPEKCSPSSVLQMLKQRVSRKMRGQRQVVPLTALRVPVGKQIGDLPGLWQARFYDFNVYSHEKKNEKLEYMHANPVNRGLVRHPQDWPWSSWAFYFRSESALVAMDRMNL